MVTFGSDAKLVGVRFDVPLVGGCNLGDSAACEVLNGFFVNRDELALHQDSGADGPEQVAIQSLFDVRASFSIHYNSSTRQNSISPWEMISLHLHQLTPPT